MCRVALKFLMVWRVFRFTLPNCCMYLSVGYLSDFRMTVAASSVEIHSSNYVGPKSCMDDTLGVYETTLEDCPSMRYLV